MDTLGLVWGLVVHAADIQDRDGAKLVLEGVQGRFSRLKLIWADGGYAGQLIGWVAQICGWMLEIVKRSDDATGFVVLPKRWIVERTFGWFGWSRAVEHAVHRRVLRRHGALLRRQHDRWRRAARPVRHMDLPASRRPLAALLPLSFHFWLGGAESGGGDIAVRRRAGGVSTSVIQPPSVTETSGMARTAFSFFRIACSAPSSVKPFTWT